MDDPTSEAMTHKVALSWGNYAIVIIVGIFLIFFSALVFVVPQPLNMAFGVVVFLVIVILVAARRNTAGNNYLKIGNDGSIIVCNSNSPIEDIQDNCIRKTYTKACLRILKENIVAASLPTDRERALVHEWSPERLKTVNSFQKLRYGAKFLENARTREYEKGFGWYSVVFASDERNLVKLILKRLLIRDDVEEYTIEEPRIFISLKNYELFIRQINQRSLSDSNHVQEVPPSLK